VVDLDVVFVKQIQSARDTLIVSVCKEGVGGKIGETIFDRFGDWPASTRDRLTTAFEHQRDADSQARSVWPECFCIG
jgi:hypothetical protein